MFIIMFCTALVVSSCGDDDDDDNKIEKEEDKITETSTLTVSVTQLDFAASKGEQSFSVKSNTSWTINGAKSWCYVSITQEYGDKDVIVEVEKNTTKEERTCRLTISTKDGLNQTVNVKQEAAETTLTVSPADITLNGEKGAKDEITITTNGHWTISNIPNWLNIPSSGDGNTTCKVETMAANNTDEDNIAELRITAEGKSASLKVTQKALREKCYIMPTNLVALHNEICFDLEAIGKINTFKYLIHSENDINRLTDLEIEAELADQNSNKYADDYILFPDSYYSEGRYYDFRPNTTYYICTIAYDVNGNPGALKKTPIKTLQYVDYDNDAFVSFSEETYNSIGFQFTCTKEGYCNTYHLIYGNLPSEYIYYPRVLYAFQINYYLKKKQKHWFTSSWGLKIETDYPNNHTFTYTTLDLAQFPTIVAMAWGVYKDGSVSSDMTGFRYDISKNSAPNRNVRVKSVYPLGERVIRRSECGKKKNK